MSLYSPESGELFFKVLIVSVDVSDAIDPMGSCIMESIARA